MEAKNTRNPSSPLSLIAARTIAGLALGVTLLTAGCGSPTAALTEPQGSSYGSLSKRNLQGGTIYFVRHAETEKNAGISSNEDAFSPKGWSQVERVTADLLQRKVVFDRIMVSPLWRTRNTVEPYIAATNSRSIVTYDAAIKECCWDSRHDNSEAIKAAAEKLRDDMNNSKNPLNVLVVGHYHAGKKFLKALTGDSVELKNATIYTFNR